MSKAAAAAEVMYVSPGAVSLTHVSQVQPVSHRLPKNAVGIT